MDTNFRDLERFKWSSESSPTKGPKRLCKFCALGIVIPIVLLCVPLYMRFQALKPHFFFLSPSDMKLLNHVSMSFKYELKTDIQVSFSILLSLLRSVSDLFNRLYINFVCISFVSKSRSTILILLLTGIKSSF